ncbi:uncharacterized protein LOC114368205 [Glycine soja]|uniref:uncharacterized protein LOC114368205 n=1 Tax=Glycine soja TaxID=3848 RepID=UPI00023CA24B|nr:uncharacterized protein LOC114368205 [Glycine soja]
MKFASTRWDEAARAYLFHLVGCTLFANKIATYVEVKFLDFFRDLKGCSMYSCGTTTLTYLCEHLTSASFDGTKQISAYATLLQETRHRIGRLLQRMIDHRLVTQGTDAYFVTEEALALARGVTDDGAMNTNRARGDTKGGHGKGGH